MLTLLLGCSSGWLNTPEWSGPLHTALYITESTEDPSVEKATVLLANSYLECSLPASEDPSELQRAIVTRYAAVTREDARLVVLTLYAFAGSAFETDYDVDAAAGTWYATVTRGSAGASYLAVNEATVDDEDGFAVLYEPGDNPGDYVLNLAVEAPGEVEVGASGEDLRGDFHLEAIDVSGRFRAERCADDADLFEQSI